MPRRPAQERIDEQLLLIDKAQKRNDEIALARVKRFQRIAEVAGAYDTNDPEALIEQAIKNAVASSKENTKTNNKTAPVNAKAQRELRVYRQNQARIERANRAIRRLKIEARRIDASQKWRLGFLLQLAERESIELHVLDQKLGEIKDNMADKSRQEKWKKLGSDRLEKEKTVEKNHPVRAFESDKADSHRKITLGGLIKKHHLDALSPALLLGALMTLED